MIAKFLFPYFQIIRILNIISSLPPFRHPSDSLPALRRAPDPARDQEPLRAQADRVLREGRPRYPGRQDKVLSAVLLLFGGVFYGGWRHLTK